MATTHTASMATPSAPIKSLHEGVVHVYVEKHIAPTLTASDVVKLFKFPDRGRFISGKLVVVPGAGALDMKVGYQRIGTATGSASLTSQFFLASTTGSATAVYDLSAAGLVGWQFSASDAEAQPYVWVQAECAAGGTHTGTTVLKLSMLYRVDD